MRGKKILMIIALVIAGILCFSGATVFAKYPEKPIRVIVAYSPGGGTDVSFRLLAKHAEKYVGVPLVVENRPGAGGEVGFTALAMAKPDGYTIGGINTPPVMAVPTERNAKYTMADFAPILIVMDDPCVWSVKKGSPYKNFKDIVAAAKKQKKAYITIGTSGIGGDDHLNILEFQRKSGIKLVHVPFAGAAPARAALLGGHITLWGGNLGEAVLLHEAGELSMLGLMAKKHNNYASYLSTAKEQGFSVFMESTRGLAAPAKIAKDRLNFLINAFSKAMADPAFLADAKKMKLPLGKEKGEEYKARLDKLDKMVKELWKKHPWRK